MQTELKNKPQVFMLLFGGLTLGSLLLKKPFHTAIPFYVLLGTMLYINVFIITNQLITLMNPDEGWFIDSNGERQRVMQMNWIWGVFTGLILSPLLVILYHKKINRNSLIEISMTTLFIISTAIIYIKHEMM